MPTDPNRFIKPTIEQLAKRAAQHCSNPICGKPTSGPHSDEQKWSLTGKAAHIHGANPGSKRHDASMSPEERRVITNGIWLCSDCATLIDTDEMRFSVDVLYRWKRRHEAKIERGQGGRAGEIERHEMLQKMFAAEPPSALQVVLDEPENWRHFLIVDLLRFRMQRQRKRRYDLFEGFTFLPARQLSKYEFLSWSPDRCRDITSLVETTIRIVTVRLNSVLSATPPIPQDILDCANLIEHICDGLYGWECEVRRTVFPEEYSSFYPRMQRWTTGFFEELERLPIEMAKPLAEPPPSGVYDIQLFFSVPAGVEDFVRDIGRVMQESG